MQPQMPTLSTLAGGVLQERFEIEFLKVCGNLVDPNCVPDAKREIVLKVSFKPMGEEGQVALTVSASSTLSPNKPTVSTMFVEQRGSLVAAVEYGPEPVPASR